MPVILGVRLKFCGRWFVALWLAALGCSQLETPPLAPIATDTPLPAPTQVSIQSLPTRVATIVPLRPATPIPTSAPEPIPLESPTSMGSPEILVEADNFRVVRSQVESEPESAIVTPQQSRIQTADNSPNGSFLSGITPHVRTIFQRGQQLGNRANVFSKVGDSLTVATYVLYPIGWGGYQLHHYEQFAPVIAYFSAANARDGNSFLNISLAADNGWTSESLLNPALANPDFCLPGEFPLSCEYRVVRPAIALILIGTNDVAELPLTAYQTNLRRIVDLSITMGVIPVLSTLPNRQGYEEQVVEFNAVIQSVAREYGIPLWDYGLVMRGLPNGGLSSDGVHPSWPPDSFDAAANFSGVNLRYGYTLRNLTALEVLDVLWKQVLLK